MRLAAPVLTDEDIERIRIQSASAIRKYEYLVRNRKNLTPEQQRELAEIEKHIDNLKQKHCKNGKG